MTEVMTDAGHIGAPPAGVLGHHGQATPQALLNLAAVHATTPPQRRRTSPRFRFRPGLWPVRPQRAGREHLALMTARSAASILRTASPRRVCSSVSRLLCAARPSSVSARPSASSVFISRSIAAHSAFAAPAAAGIRGRDAIRARDVYRDTAKREKRSSLNRLAPSPVRRSNSDSNRRQSRSAIRSRSTSQRLRQ